MTAHDLIFESLRGLAAGDIGIVRAARDVISETPAMRWRELLKTAAETNDALTIFLIALNLGAFVEQDLDTPEENTATAFAIHACNALIPMGSEEAANLMQEIIQSNSQLTAQGVLAAKEAREWGRLILLGIAIGSAAASETEGD